MKFMEMSKQVINSLHLSDKIKKDPGEFLNKIKRFTSLAHLSRIVLFLKKNHPTVTQKEVMMSAGREFALSEEFIWIMFGIKSGKITAGRKELELYFQQKLDLVRALDEAVYGIIL